MAKCTLSSVALFCASVACGVATLFAYNSFFASPSYLEKYYQFASVKNTDDIRTLPTAKLSAWKSITTWSTVLQAIPMFLMQIVMLTPWVLGINVKWRIIGGAGALLISMLLLPACSASGGLSENSSLAVLFIACVCSGLSTCVLQSSCFAFFGTLPTLYVLGFIFGSGLSGPINSILRIIIAVSLPTTFHGVKTGATIFFTIGMVLMFVTILIAFFLQYNDIVVEYSSAYQKKDNASKYKNNQNNNNSTSSLDDDNCNDTSEQETERQNVNTAHNAQSTHSHHANSNNNNCREAEMNTSNKEGISDDVGVIEHGEEGNNNNNNNGAHDKHSQSGNTDERGTELNHVRSDEVDNEQLNDRKNCMSSDSTHDVSPAKSADNEAEIRKSDAFTVIRKI